MPEPSQTELSGASRYSRGSPDSSTYPLPPRHSSASAVAIGVRLHTQYLAAGRASRSSDASPASPRAARSAAPARRTASAVAASDSRTRSARTAAISGWETSVAPNERRALA